MAKISLKQLTKTRYTAHIKTTPEENAECDKKAFDAIQSRVKIDGFRKGKVPEHIVKTRYGADIEERSVNNLIEMASEQLIKESEKEIYKIRKVENLEKDKNAYSFDLIFDTVPEVNLGKMKGVTIREFVADIDESDIQKEIREMMKPRAEKKLKADGEKAVEGDMLVVRYEQWADGAPLGDPAEGIQLFLGENLFDEELESQIIKQAGKKGDEFRISRNVKQSDSTEKKIDVIVKIDDIYAMEYPELTDEFASAYDDEYKTAKELKTDLQKVLLGRFHVRNMDQEIGAAIEKINEMAEIELPELYMEEKIQRYLEENKINLENFPQKEQDEFREIFTREHKKRLVNEFIMKESMAGMKGEEYREGFMKFMDENFDKKNTRIFRQIYDNAMNSRENQYTQQLLEKLLRVYHMNLMENYFRSKGLVKKDKKIKFAEFFKENQAEK